uniref:Uncharacterized protein n=1 Tax=Anas platyrhynchos platyrhynchos TaxID=8840 RepID=A0A493U0N7_ANAPP
GDCRSPHQHLSVAHPEVLGVHVQLVAVQLGQLGEGVLDVVQVLHGISEGGEHFLAMGADHGVAKDGGGAGQVAEGGEEPLGPGVDDQQPAERKGEKHTHPINAPSCDCSGFSMQVQLSRCPGAEPTWPGPQHHSRPH